MQFIRNSCLILAGTLCICSAVLGQGPASALASVTPAAASVTPVTPVTAVTAGAPGPAAASVTPPPAKPAQATPAAAQPAVSGPLVIDVFGDSLADGLWAGLYAVLKKHPEDKLYRHSKVGTGLTNPAFNDWMKEMTAQLDADHPTNVVVMYGANDEQSLRDDAHKGYNFKSEGWKAVYTGRINAILAETAKRHIATVWVGLPVMRGDEMNSGATYLDQLYASTVAQANIRFIPLADTFKGPDGAFATHLPDAAGHLHLVRADDGVHFTPYGYEIIAEKVYTAMLTPESGS